MRMIALFFALILLPAGMAQACMGAMLEDSLFFEQMPEPTLDADVVARVTIKQIVPDHEPNAMVTAAARVDEVVSGSTKVGDIIELRYIVSSCGPNQKEGNSGLIIAKHTTDIKGRAALTPYTIRPSDGRIDSPVQRW